MPDQSWKAETLPDPIRLRHRPKDLGCHLLPIQGSCQETGLEEDQPELTRRCQQCVFRICSLLHVIAWSTAIEEGALQ